MNGKTKLVFKTAMTAALLLTPPAARCAGQEAMHIPHEHIDTLLVSLAVLLVAVIVFLLLRIRTLSRLRDIQEREKQISARITGILNTMPLLYMYEKMITDEKGTIVDTRYRDVNKFFTDQLYKREECIGHLGSELFPDSMTVFLKASNLAKQTGNSLNFQYYYPDKSRFFDIMVHPVEGGRFMEYFCMDCTDLHNAQCTREVARAEQEDGDCPGGRARLALALRSGEPAVL